MSQQPKAERPNDFNTMRLPHAMQPVPNPNFPLQCHEAKNLRMREDPDDSETRLIDLLDPFVHGEDWSVDNSHTSSQGSADSKRGGSMEAHLRTARIMAPDSLVRLCYIYIIDSLYP